MDSGSFRDRGSAGIIVVSLLWSGMQRTDCIATSRGLWFNRVLFVRSNGGLYTWKRNAFLEPTLFWWPLQDHPCVTSTLNISRLNNIFALMVGTDKEVPILTDHGKSFLGTVISRGYPGSNVMMPLRQQLDLVLSGPHLGPQVLIPWDERDDETTMRLAMICDLLFITR